MSIFENQPKRTFAGSVVQPLVFLLLATTVAPYRAFMLSKVWAWYVIPFWPNLAVNRWALYGLFTLVGWAAISPPDFSKETEQTRTSEWIVRFVWMWLAISIELLIAWVVKGLFVRGGA